MTMFDQTLTTRFDASPRAPDVATAGV